MVHIKRPGLYSLRNVSRCMRSSKASSRRVSISNQPEPFASETGKGNPNPAIVLFTLLRLNRSLSFPPTPPGTAAMLVVRNREYYSQCCIPGIALTVQIPTQTFGPKRQRDLLKKPLKE